MNFSKLGWGIFACSAAAVLFWLATRADVYDATSPNGMSQALLGVHAPSLPHPWWLSLHLFLRKAYSIVAFAIVGIATHSVLPRASRPRFRAACIVALYSAAIECAQYAVDPGEPNLERAFDIACGGFGGWSGVWVYESIRSRYAGRLHQRR